MPDGKVTTTIIKTPPTETTTTPKPPPEPTTQITEVEYPPLPQKPDDYNTNLKTIHQNAANIIKLQEQQKTQGQLTEPEQEIFKESVDSLNEASDNLARLQEDDDDDDYEDDGGGTLSAWFERKKNNKLNKDKKKEGGGGGGGKEGEEKEEGEDGEDGIAINLPPEDASVAEAKPVGLAIAGECLLIY